MFSQSKKIFIKLFTHTRATVSLPTSIQYSGNGPSSFLIYTVFFMIRTQRAAVASRRATNLATHGWLSSGKI